jgi:hypothetical protein
MADEVSVFQDPNIHVTNLRAIFPTKTYAMANVTSVSTQTQTGSPVVGVIMIAIGAITILGGIGRDLSVGALVFGVILIGLGVGVVQSMKTRYWVRIGSASGETNALSSLDRAYIERVVNAINEAIIQRG